ncbi:MAG TPA: hypothetical protein VLT88_04510 [Desulfosarcina sp.]|nr:hypothetical protein [Desulfosarcina sp.]
MRFDKTGVVSGDFEDRFEDEIPERDEAFDDEDYAKTEVGCICPGCGKMHMMKMRWIGRGVPRKFCQNCRDRETPLDEF